MLSARPGDFSAAACFQRARSFGFSVAVYVLDAASGKGHLSFFEKFDDVDVYFRSGNDAIQDWYAKWLRRLLRLRTGTTVFKHLDPI